MSQSQGNAVPNELLRAVIREVLQDVVANEVTAASATRAGVDRAEKVVIATQEDLDRAIARVLADAANPSRRRAIELGRTRFVLADGNHANPRASGSVPATRNVVATERITRGAVTERHVIAAAQAGSAIVIGEKVVITPLAKERARATGVEIRRER